MNRGLEKAKADVRPAVAPRVDVYENDSELLLAVDMPGVAKDAVDVRFEDGQIVLEGRRDFAPSGSLLAEEWRARDYRRVFALPEGIDAEKVEAKLDAGVLTMHLPKAAAKRARRIEVRSG